MSHDGSSTTLPAWPQCAVEWTPSLHACNENKGALLDWQSVLACELHSLKRRFLMSYHRCIVPRVFADVAHIVPDEMAYDLFEGAASGRARPRCYKLVHRWLFTNATGATSLSRDTKTDSVFGHILDYLSQTSVAFCILENVLALAINWQAWANPSEIALAS